MAAKKYFNLDVEFSAVEPGTYRVKVGGPGRDPDTVDFVPPLSGLELAAFRRRLPGGQRGGVQVDTGDWPNDLAASKDVGARLYRAVFHDRALAQLALAQDAAVREDAGLRIRLNTSAAPELARLPWEYLYDAAVDRTRFLAQYDATPIVRYLSLGGQGWRTMGVTTALRVLVLIPKPSDLQALGLDDLALDQEWANIREALSELGLEGQVVIEPLEMATQSAIRQRLRQQDFHVLHFVGHGFVSPSQESQILLVDETGKGAAVGAEEFSSWLADFDTLRLVMLNSCFGAHADTTDAFAGTAQQLIKSGIPAVVAMQVAISDPAAIGCAREFYRALADGYPIEGAVASARQAIRGAREAYELEWATPALYLRATDGQLWNMAPLSAEARTQKRWQSLRRLAREAERRRDMPSAIRHWQELAALAERLPAGTEANNRIRDLQDAETYYARGLELYQAGDWQGAYDCFREQLNRRGGRDGNVLGLLEETRGKLRDPAKNRPVRLDAHIKKVVAELADRQVVIFLGSDVNVTGRTDLTRWSKGQLPTGTELARYLVGVGPHAYPREDEADLGRVAQWVDTFGIQGEVYDAIRDKLEVAFPATPLHHVLASRLPELRDPDAPNHPLIVVTATLDDGLEFALDRADEPYELVAYRARENGRRPLFEHRSFESDGPTPIEDATRYVEIPRDPAVRVLLVKIHGGFDRRGGRKDSFVVTEDDYLDYSRHISRLLPKGLTDLLRDKYFLFLGYSLQDWSLRVFLHALKDEVWGDRDRGKPAWAVQAEPSDLDRRLWERWGVGLVEAPLDLYVAALRAEVEARLA